MSTDEVILSEKKRKTKSGSSHDQHESDHLEAEMLSPQSLPGTFKS